MGKFYSTKTYNTDRGLSCCFRQWRSHHSHCSLLHGYSIGVKVIFECDSLDERNWVQDFGGLKPFKEWLDYMFDHTLIVAEDDPMLDRFKELAGWTSRTEPPTYSSATWTEPAAHPLQRGGVCDLRIVPAVGCERFAELAWNKLTQILKSTHQLNLTVRVKSVEVFEHGANSAIYEG